MYIVVSCFREKPECSTCSLLLHEVSSAGRLRKVEDTGSAGSGEGSSEGTEDRSGSERDGDSAAPLPQELEQARAENARLTGQVRSLNTRVASLNTRVNDLW